MAGEYREPNLESYVVADVPGTGGFRQDNGVSGRIMILGRVGCVNMRQIKCAPGQLASRYSNVDAVSRRRDPSGSSTGVLPERTTWRGPRTAAAGFAGTTWPVTSQSKRWRMAASCCFTLGAATSRPCCSIQLATCRG